MHDDDTRLAEVARRALADASTVTLLVDAAAAPACGPVLLTAPDGRPRFGCAAGSAVAVAAAARARAVLEIPADARPADGHGSVILAGRLEAGASGDTAVVTLEPSSLVVEVPAPAGWAPRQVPLGAYRHAAARAVAESIRRHTNERHGDRLRACAAVRAGLGQDEVLAAWLADVTHDGAVLEWLDASGGHVVRLGFPHPAGDAHELAALLRAQLCGRRRAL